MPKPILADASCLIFLEKTWPGNDFFFGGLAENRHVEQVGLIDEPLTTQHGFERGRKCEVYPALVEGS